jgi:hypothetical protein
MCIEKQKAEGAGIKLKAIYYNFNSSLTDQSSLLQ